MKNKPDPITTFKFIKCNKKRVRKSRETIALSKEGVYLKYRYYQAGARAEVFFDPAPTPEPGM
jgi:hypothetical protein